MNEYKYINGFLHHPEWMIETNSQKDGKHKSYFFTEKEAEKKYSEWSKWAGVSIPVHVTPPPPIECTPALQKILQEGKIYTDGIFFIISIRYLSCGQWVSSVSDKSQVEDQKMIADVHHYPVLLQTSRGTVHSTLKDTEIPMPWHHLWHEVHWWQRDIAQKETAEQFIHRLQQMFTLTENKKV